MKIKTRKRNLKFVALVACAVLVVCGSLMIAHAIRQRQQWEPADADVSRPELDTSVTYNGKTYTPKEDLETILLMGLDKYQKDTEQFGYLNDQQADFLLLLVLDEKTKTANLLHLNRDTMTEITRLGVGGGEADRFTGQLALAHTFGSGGSDSCLNTVKAVSKLLGGIRIQHYVSITMDAVATLNDLVGGVTVTIQDNFSQVDPTLVQGTEVRLKGEQALTYVRVRRNMEDSSNLARMERQRQYMQAFYEQLMKCCNTDPSFFEKNYVKVAEYVQTDCTIYQLQSLTEGMEQYQLDTIYTLDGNTQKGEEFMEFYPDKDSISNVILNLFYEPAA